MDAISIRDAKETDLAAINDIYNYYVLNSTCTYQTEPSNLEARQKWFAEHAAPYVVTVAESGGKLVGWSSLSKFRARAAYAKTVENSVYLHPDWQGKGIGKALMIDLIERAKRADFHTIIALVSADQGPSMGLHQALGFTRAGEIKQVGNKFDRWLDVAYWQLML